MEAGGSPSSVRPRSDLDSYKELAVLAVLVQVALPDILLRRHVIFASL